MTYDPSKVVFVDTETTGLDPQRHHVWEIGLIIPDGALVEQRMVVRIVETTADQIALGVGNYHERHPDGRLYSPQGPHKVVLTKAESAAKRVAMATHGRHIVGAVPDFDARFLTKLLTAHGFLPSWHYHLIDVEALMVGWLRARPSELVSAVSPLPWKSRDLATAVGVNNDDPAFAQHTALGDARWAKACFEAVMGQPEVKP